MAKKNFLADVMKKGKEEKAGKVAVKVSAKPKDFFKSARDKMAADKAKK